MKTVEGRRPGEIVFGLLLLIFSSWLLHKSFQIDGFNSLSGPGVFPMLASSVMIVSSIFILLKSVKMDGGQGVKYPSVGSYLIPFRTLVFVPMMGAFALAMPQIGFFPSATIFIFFSILFLWRQGLIKTALVTAISVAVIYVIFRLVFKVILPSGVLWQ